MKKFLFGIIAIFITIFGNAQPFQINEAVSSVLTNVSDGCVRWFDYDLDGDYDILITGNTQSEPVTKIFNQETGIFTDMFAGLTALSYSDASLTDIDNDNDPDLFISGATLTGDELIPNSFLFKNNNGVFEQITSDISAVYSGSSGWGDLDNDGDYDLVITGNTGETGITKIYKNDGNFEFNEINSNLVGILQGEVDLGDYDNDMDVDILVGGFFKNAQGDSIRTLKVYRNDGDFSFSAISGPFIGMGQCNVSWWDYDNDGDLDIIANGSTDAPTYLVYIYQNLGNDIFSNIGIEIFGTVNGSLSCADYDNDGDEDFLLTGHSSYNNQSISVIYINVANNLFNKDYSVVLTEVENSSSRWCDYDNNGNTDLVISGFNSLTGEITTAVFDNKNLLINTPPSVPENLSYELIDGKVILSWSASTDVETPDAALTYNLRVGTTPGGSEIVSSMTTETAKRAIVGPGNVFHNTSRLLKNLEPGTYFFSVQAVDNGFESSGFSEELSFTVTTSGNTGYLNISRPDILIAPNPATSFTVIEIFYKKVNDCRVEIFDNSGRLVKQPEVTDDGGGKLSAFWDLTDNNSRFVKDGCYTAIVQYADKKSSSRKIVIRR